MLENYWKIIRGSPKRWMVAALGAVLLVLVLHAGQQALLQRLYPFPYRDEIRTYSRLNGLDPRFVASIIKNESRFRPTAVSPKGALGLMQIMPDTGRWASEQMGFADFDPDMLRDPATNIMIGTWYLSQLRHEFGGNFVLVVAAYNAGRGRVREWLEKEGYESDSGVTCDLAVWPGLEVTEDYPVSKLAIAETRSYVKNVTDSLKHYRRIYRDIEEPCEG
jgi:soluble lytic murein transglycosylase